jgi:hypothetical protein
VLADPGEHSTNTLGDKSDDRKVRVDRVSEAPADATVRKDDCGLFYYGDRGPRDPVEETTGLLDRLSRLL